MPIDVMTPEKFGETETSFLKIAGAFNKYVKCYLNKMSRNTCANRMRLSLIA